MTRITTSLALIALVCVAALTSQTHAGEDIALPLRKAGQWELKTVMDEGAGPKEQVLTICIDADMEKNTVAASNMEHKQSCSKYEISKTGDTIIVDAQCNFNERDVTSRTEMSGDFAKAFHVKIDSTTSGTDGARSVSVKRTITQTGTYVSDNCGELKGGEAKGTDGKKILVQ
jgi:hypothetical protein